MNSKIRRSITTRIKKTNFEFNMTKHYTNPEEQALHGIAEWIEENTLDISNWLTNGPLWVILNVYRIKVARIDPGHPLWKYLDYESQHRELNGMKQNYLMWHGGAEYIGDRRPIIVTHFGPFGPDKIEFEGFDDRFDKFKKMFWGGVEKIITGIENFCDLDKDERRTILAHEVYNLIGPLLEENIHELVVQRARLFGDNNLTWSDYTKLLTKCLGQVAANSIIKNTIAKRAARGFVKILPFAGFCYGIGLGIRRGLHGDVGGCVLEMTSGVMANVPGLGTAASGMIDASLLLLDIKGHVQTELEKKITEKNKNLNVIKDAMAKNKSYRYEDLFKAVESFIDA